MHELSLVKDALRKAEAVAREAGSGRVLEVTLRLGMLAGISAGVFQEQFAAVARGTIVEGARVEVYVDDKITAGAQELTLESVEVES